MKLGRPLLTTDMSGSLGGMVAAKARGGLLYIRSRVRPSNPRSGFQSTARLALAGLAAAWAGTLTDVQRAAWAAKAGPTESGVDIFVRANSQIVLAGDNFVHAPPATVALDAVPVSLIAYDISDHAVKFSNSTFGDDNAVNIYLSTRPQRSSRLAQQFPYRYLGNVPLADAGAQTLDFNGTWAQGKFVAGDIVYIRFVQYTQTGQVAIDQTARVVVQA